MICNGNRTEWSPIRSVIIRVITAQRGSDLFIKSMITDRIGRHEVLSSINHKITISEKNSQVVKKEKVRIKIQKQNKKAKTQKQAQAHAYVITTLNVTGCFKLHL